MSYDLSIHTVFEERTSHAEHDWSLERAQVIPTPPPAIRFHLDLQMGPIFITIGPKVEEHTPAKSH